MKYFVAALSGAASFLGAAHGDVVASAPDGFHVEQSYQTFADVEAVMDAFQDVSAWWLHSFSGDVTNMDLPNLQSGSVWLESWDDKSVEHGRVLSFTGDTVTFISALGPLQPMAVEGVFTFAAKPSEDEGHIGTTEIVFDYRVNGSSLSALDAIAPAVDGVWKEALERLVANLEPED